MVVPYLRLYLYALDDYDLSKFSRLSNFFTRIKKCMIINTVIKPVCAFISSLLASISINNHIIIHPINGYSVASDQSALIN
jgi:hypothetical protein